jgi:hypothetical protein
MSTVQPNYLFINTLQATGLDIVTAEGILTIGNSSTGNVAPGMKFNNMESVYTKAGAAAVNQVVTAVLPASTVVGENYAFQVTQQNSVGEFVTYYIAFDATTTTTATAHAGMISVLNALVASGSLSVTVGGSSPNITITGTATNPIVTGEALENMVSTGVTTTGNEAFGLGADLVAEGIIGISAQPAVGTTYNLFLINFYNESNALNAQERKVQAQTYVYYNNTAGAPLTAFEADLLAKVYTITSAANAGPAVSVEKL